MSDVVLGILAILVGALFCFRGYLTMRIVFPIWGFFAGFVFGAGLVAGWGNDGFLTTAVGWLVGLVIGIALALVAYLSFAVAVVLAMSAIGFAIGTGFMVAIGVSWSWVIALVGVAVGLLLALFSIAGNMPMIVLTVLTAAAGATAIVGGIMLLGGTFNSDQLTEGGIITDALHDDWWWYAIYLGLAVSGIVVQILSSGPLGGTMRESWEAAHHKSTAPI